MKKSSNPVSSENFNAFVLLQQPLDRLSYRKHTLEQEYLFWGRLPNAHRSAQWVEFFALSNLFLNYYENFLSNFESSFLSLSELYNCY